MIKLELTIDDVNGVMGALGKMPYELAFALIEKIKSQAVPQLNAVQAEAPAEEVK